MHIDLLQRLSLELSGYATEYSQPFALEGFNAIQIEAVVSRLTATNLTITIMESNDNQNWREVSGTTETITAEGFKLGTKRTGLGCAFYHLKLVITGSAGQIALLSCGVNLSSQT